MSFTLGLPFLRDVDGEALREALYRGALARNPAWAVHFADGSGAREVSGIEPDEWEAGRCDSLHFTRFGGATFMQRIFDVADQFDGFFYWPEPERPCMAVTRAELLQVLPAEIDRAEVVIVRDGDQLLEAIVGPSAPADA